MVSSEKLAWLCQVNSAQVRKDLGYFGEFGVRGVGYDVIDLQAQIKKILAINRNWNLGIVGVGKLGSALLQHHNFSDRGFKCVAAFDNAPDKIGETLASGLKVRDIDELDEAIEALDIEIGVITTPASAAQKVADLLLDANVNAASSYFDIESCTAYTPGDINKDCIVDMEDVAILSAGWLECTNPFNPTCQ